MPKVYLAARYSRNDEMRGVRDVLEAIGYTVTSEWIDCHAGKYPTSFTAEILNDDPEYCSSIALKDVENLFAADILIHFGGEGGKGGRHVEFGMAVAANKKVIHVGPREHVFHTLPIVEVYTDWSRLVMALSARQALDAHIFDYG